MASIVFEVECEVEGNVTPAEPDVGIMGPGVEDAGLSSVSMLKLERVKSDSIFKFKTVCRSIDLLEGLDPTSRNIVIANIMAAFSTEIDEAILSDA